MAALLRLSLVGLRWAVGKMLSAAGFRLPATSYEFWVTSFSADSIVENWVVLIGLLFLMELVFV